MTQSDATIISVIKLIKVVGISNILRRKQQGNEGYYELSSHVCTQLHYRCSSLLEGNEDKFGGEQDEPYNCFLPKCPLPKRQ